MINIVRKPYLGAVYKDYMENIGSLELLVLTSFRCCAALYGEYWVIGLLGAVQHDYMENIGSLDYKVLCSMIIWRILGHWIIRCCAA